MCIFSGEAEVSNTHIFARRGETEASRNRQLLIYGMELTNEAPVAMALPLPTKVSTTSIEWVDMSPDPRFFEDLSALFPAFMTRSLGPVCFSADEQLPVARVGEFEASFVPSAADFFRLDPRFRIDTSIVEALGVDRSWGWAVFQFQPGTRKAHPMAFWFDTYFPNHLYYPTKHSHAGDAPEHAEFDHKLFFQLPAGSRQRVKATPRGFRKRGCTVNPARFVGGWSGSPALQGQGFLARSRCVSLEPIHLVEAHGNLPNLDTVVGTKKVNYGFVEMYG